MRTAPIPKESSAATQQAIRLEGIVSGVNVVLETNEKNQQRCHFVNQTMLAYVKTRQHRLELSRMAAIQRIGEVLWKSNLAPRHKYSAMRAEVRAVAEHAQSTAQSLRVFAERLTPTRQHFQFLDSAESDAFLPPGAATSSFLQRLVELRGGKHLAALPSAT